MEQRLETLGSDLNSSRYSIHITPARRFRNIRSGAILPSGYSFLAATSLHDAPLMGHEKMIYASPHNPGEEMHTWAMPFEYLEILKSRQEPEAYICKVRELLERELRLRENSLEFEKESLNDPLAGRNMRRVITYLENNIRVLKSIILRCSTVEAADKAITFLIKLKSLSYSCPECPTEVIGIIFAINQRIRDECDIREDTKGGFTVHACDNELLLNVSHVWNDQPGNIPSYALSVDGSGGITAVSKHFYSQFLHALWVVYPGEEAADRVVRNMFHTTKNTPEHMVPVYNYAGRLYWPGKS